VRLALLLLALLFAPPVHADSVIFWAGDSIAVGCGAPRTGTAKQWARLARGGAMYSSAIVCLYPPGGTCIWRPWSGRYLQPFTQPLTPGDAVRQLSMLSPNDFLVVSLGANDKATGRSESQIRSGVRRVFRPDRDGDGDEDPGWWADSACILPFLAPILEPGLNATRAIIESECVALGIAVWDGREVDLLAEDFSDGLHPNTGGCAKIHAWLTAQAVCSGWSDPD